MSSSCTAVPTDEEASLVWSDEALPLRAIILADISIESSNRFVSPVEIPITYASNELVNIC